jgi:UDP-N-acetylmuramyl pentapeptide phosphotransferase/UDP-N-acetylglucosamine-1-phosphate transferase
MQHLPPLILAATWLFSVFRLTPWLLRRLNLYRENYRGDSILTACGLAILLWSAPVLTGLCVALPGQAKEALAYLCVVCGMGMLGFLDDCRGDRSIKGLRGHFRALFRGRITTGFVKAVGGLLLSLLVSRLVLGYAWTQATLSGLLIALCANALNLFDLRPGRACAVFFTGAMVVVLFQAGTRMTPPPLILAVVLPTLFVYAKDRRGAAMLGDTGSNLLGGTLGLGLVLAFPSAMVQGGLLLGLVGLHLLAERHSLTRIIESTPLLRRLDSWTGVR